MINKILYLTLVSALLISCSDDSGVRPLSKPDSNLRPKAKPESKAKSTAAKRGSPITIACTALKFSSAHISGSYYEVRMRFLGSYEGLSV